MMSAAYSQIKAIAAPSNGLDMGVSGATVGGLTVASLSTHSGFDLHATETFDAYHVCSASQGRVLQFDRGEVNPIPADGAIYLRDSSAVTRSVFEPRSRIEGISIAAETLHAALSELIEAPVVSRVRFALRVERDVPVFRSLFLMARALQEGLAGAAPLATAPVASTSLRESMVHLLLHGTPHSYSEVLGQQRVPSLLPRQVRRAMDYMQAHAHRPLTVSEIAAAAEVSTRTLQSSFQRFNQTSPLQYLRQLRLTGARRDMLDPGQPLSISVIALNWGFSHMGMFALQYRAAYGELPRETLAQRR
ncbi:AraC family transcriptional regulator [Paracidovorax wautersii]|uniref:AraC family transcriptional regulator n=1 Tax=Paracidovorax wautersii TaxID=1177982 RepID=UPI0031E46FBD